MDRDIQNQLMELQQQKKKKKLINNILKNLPIRESLVLEAKKYEFPLQVMKMKEEMAIGHRWIAVYHKCIDQGVCF